MENNNKKKIADIDFHYLKTNSYRTYHVDGIFGGLTSRGNLYAELFLERNATPKMVKHKVKETGELGDEILREGKKGFIRQIECGLMMDINTAKTFHTWLGDKINDFDKYFKEQIKDD